MPWLLLAARLPRRRVLGVVLLLLTVGCALSASGTQLRAADGGRTLGMPGDAQRAVVTGHVDGDTVTLTGVGAGPLPIGTATKVRVLEIDTPEVFGRVDCFGPEASAFARRTLPERSTVWVSRDGD